LGRRVIFHLVEYVLLSRRTIQMKLLEKDATIRLLGPADINGAMRLTRAAGWNQLPSDWERLLSLEPEGCFTLESGGRVAATTTVVCYGRELAWLGMVLTAPEFRRRGFAESLIARAMQFVERSGVATVKLDATDTGINLYRKLGFVEECEIHRWQRAPGPVEAAEILPYRSDLLYDRAGFGADRTALLAELAEFGAASLPGEGYAMGRPGFSAAYFGPCLAKSPESVRKLLRWFLANHGGEHIFWDLFPVNLEAVRIAREFGFAPVRRLVRMALFRTAARPITNQAEVFAIAGFELG
jgi:GNAT superfamily N-acetyltransferase